ncbi:tryptophan-rich sensory protein [Salinisphaera sp. USBA-960]|nr:tryptophan-rich sensory protein [Salifodinibacter halophilus]NNC26726.1 tryptophan-rich sensory protein [Salifodinibacter halophilus]
MRAAVIITLAVGLASSTGSLFPPGPWYAGLTHPLGTPPATAFPIIRTLMYVAMAVAAWLVWQSAGFGRALALFTLQLVLNAAWMPTAFGAHLLEGSVVVIIALWLTLAATIIECWFANRAASILLWPCLAWITYVGYLAIGLALLN